MCECLQIEVSLPSALPGEILGIHVCYGEKGKNECNFNFEQTLICGLQEQGLILFGK